MLLREIIAVFTIRNAGNTLKLELDGFGGLVDSMLASGTKVCGFKPGRSRWIFTGRKNPQHALPPEGK